MVKFRVFRPVIVTVVNYFDVVFRILVSNLFYFDLRYFYQPQAESNFGVGSSSFLFFFSSSGDFCFLAMIF